MQEPWGKLKNPALKCYSLQSSCNILNGQVVHHGWQQVFEHLFPMRQPRPLPVDWAAWTFSLVWQVQPESSSHSSHQTKTKQMLPAQVLGCFNGNLSFKTTSTPHWWRKVIFKIGWLKKKRNYLWGLLLKKWFLNSWWGVIFGKCLVAGSTWVFCLPLCAGTYGLSGYVWSGSSPVL